jgi:hypothetical protein
MRVGRMLASDNTKHKSAPHVYRRPHGVAVLNISELLHRDRDAGATQDVEQEFTFKVMITFYSFNIIILLCFIIVIIYTLHNFIFL